LRPLAKLSSPLPSLALLPSPGIHTFLNMAQWFVSTMPVALAKRRHQFQGKKALKKTCWETTVRLKMG